MPVDDPKVIKQQPMDSDAADKYYPFPSLIGLDKPEKPKQEPVRRITLQLPSEDSTLQPPENKQIISASPFHGVTRLAVVAGDNISQTFNNGKGDVDPQGQVLPGGKKGRYYDEVTDNFRLDPDGDKPKICWKVRNTDGFTKARFELFSRDRAEPIWSLTWDKAQIMANIRSGALAAGAKEKDGQTIPIRWTGSLDWAETVKITDPAFPDGRLTPDHSPYQLRLTINDGQPGPTKMGYPLIAWTYIYVLDTQKPEGSTDIGTGWLLVQLTYQGLKLAGLPVQFYTLAANNQKGEPVGQAQVTDEQGLARLAQPVAVGEYGCQIQNQPLAIISTLEEPTEPFVLELPIGTPQVELYDALADELDEAEEALAEAEEPLEEAGQGWLSVQLVYQGLMLSGLPVQFCSLTEANQPGARVGQAQVTDEYGVARLAEPVSLGYYGCQIKNQPLAIVSPTEDATNPFILELPIGAPQVEMYDPVVEQLDDDDIQFEEITDTSKRGQ
jgi:hypothetical protein